MSIDTLPYTGLPERIFVLREMKYYLVLLCGNWGLIVITGIYPTVTRNRGNFAFCTVIGFTVTGDYEFLGNLLHGIGTCFFSRNG